jgi:hypothetical protein
MIQKLKTLFLSTGALFMLAVPALVPAAALAVDQDQINGALCNGANINLDTNSDLPANGNSCKTNNGGPDLTATIKKIINILSILVGAIAVIMIIFGGFRYVTSGGSDSSVSSAKNTILYAVIGLIIVALAQVIVHFVLNNIAS